MKKRVKDDYKKYARILPAVLSMIVPCLSTIYFMFNLSWVNNFLTIEFSKVWGTLLVFFPCSLIYGAIGYAASELFRSISKIIFQYKLFEEDETKMPTTDFLIFKRSPFSTIYINNIMDKINEDFKIVLSDKSAQDKDELEARKEIANVVQMIRNITRDDNILLQYNIQFGFLRNLMGGMIIAFIISFLLFFISLFYGEPWIVHLILCFVDVLIFLVSFIILKYRARAYARQLYSTYLTINK